MNHKSRSSRLALRSVLFIIAGVAMFTVSPAPAHASWHYPTHMGIRCQNDFQYGWAPTIDTYSMCWDFISQIRTTDYVDFYFNLHGAAPAFQYGNGAETCNGCGGVDSVDFFLMNTHGGIASNNPDYAGYAMWDYYSIAWTPDMRLGSSGEQVKVLATYACDTFKTSDGHFWDRWGNAYRGGLKIGVGAHDLVYDGNSQKGTEFASRMQDGEPIGQAWNEAVWYADNNNHPSVANTGANANDCWNRMRTNMSSILYLQILRDSQIGYVCWSGWNGD
jgi:hypothetical protein